MGCVGERKVRNQEQWKTCGIGEGYLKCSGFRKYGFKCEELTSKEDQKLRGDFVLEDECGNLFNAEVKTENNMPPNLPVEVWQCVNKREPGWIQYNKLGDLMFYVRLKDNKVNEVWMIDFHWLRRVYQDFGQHHWRLRHSSKGYGKTEFRACPLGPNYHWMQLVDSDRLAPV